MIITISRQTGSGGHTVGRLLAEKLGYEFYDKEIVASVAASMGIDEKLILENGENMSDQDYIDMKVSVFKRPSLQRQRNQISNPACHIL